MNQLRIVLVESRGKGGDEEWGRGARAKIPRHLPACIKPLAKTSCLLSSNGCFVVPGPICRFLCPYPPRGSPISTTQLSLDKTVIAPITAHNFHQSTPLSRVNLRKGVWLS